MITILTTNDDFIRSTLATLAHGPDQYWLAISFWAETGTKNSLAIVSLSMGWVVRSKQTPSFLLMKA